MWVLFSLVQMVVIKRVLWLGLTPYEVLKRVSNEDENMNCGLEMERESRLTIKPQILSSFSSSLLDRFQ